MELNRRNRSVSASKIIFLFFHLLYISLLLLLFLCSSSNTSCTGPDTTTTRSLFQTNNLQVAVAGRRGLGQGGPGSSPPRCASKCGNCTPCKPVHVAVPVPPGTPVTADYYPEAWRCKCRNKLYMP
ncbi:EPIDERMAL PATTERNING FACTOR-like protein 5 [Momordica charantia]|uniref:Epidermal patterning factor-like protein n=1 Tax=Momordica charantia TaxID=3673 RepID=A0A6J1DKY2_MOMCH|nr:EPIDERMAL PATTERNING FACTOR-like protein 5 [Momordica charantia]